MNAALSDTPGIVVNIKDHEKMVKITTHIPASYLSAITALKWKRKLRQGDIITEALRLYLEREAGR